MIADNFYPIFTQTRSPFQHILYKKKQKQLGLCPHQHISLDPLGSLQAPHPLGAIKEWVWNSRTKLCCTASGEWNGSRVSLQEFDIGYMF